MDRCNTCFFDNNVEETTTYKKNDFIFFEGDEIKNIYRIVSGNVKLEKVHENGEVRIIDVVTSGDYLALLTVLKGQSDYIVTATALNDCVLKPISKVEAGRSYEENLEFKETCLKCAANRIGLFQGHMFNSANTEPEAQVLNIIRHLSEKFGRKVNDEIHVDLPINKTELANMVGLRRETLSRKLKLLQDNGKLKIIKNKYIIESM